MFKWSMDNTLASTIYFWDSRGCILLVSRCLNFHLLASFQLFYNIQSLGGIRRWDLISSIINETGLAERKDKIINVRERVARITKDGTYFFIAAKMAACPITDTWITEKDERILKHLSYDYFDRWCKPKKIVFYGNYNSFCLINSHKHGYEKRKRTATSANDER